MRESFRKTITCIVAMALVFMNAYALGPARAHVAPSVARISHDHASTTRQVDELHDHVRHGHAASLSTHAHDHNAATTDDVNSPLPVSPNQPNQMSGDYGCCYAACAPGALIFSAPYFPDVVRAGQLISAPWIALHPAPSRSLDPPPRAA